MHILRLCKKYGYSLDSLHHLFHSLIIPCFTYGILVWGIASYDKYLSKIGKFHGRVVRFGFIKEAPAILSLLEPEASDKKLWNSKSITNSTKGRSVDHLPPSKTRLSNRSHSYVLPFKLGLNGLNAVLVIGVFSVLSIVNCNLERLFTYS